jgi:hypothetical protein
MTTEMGLDPISDVPLLSITPSPENDDLYKPVDVTTPDFRKFARGIRENGIKVCVPNISNESFQTCIHYLSSNTR